MLTDLFGQVPQKLQVPRARRVQRDFGQEPEQRALRMKLLRKIAFRKRYHEVAGVGNTESFCIGRIMRYHTVLFNDWESTFPVCERAEDKLDYWLWMLGDIHAPFSFRDCLIAVGYRRVDDVIEEIHSNVPDWVSEIIDASAAEQERLLLPLCEAPSAFLHRLKRIKNRASKASKTRATKAA